ncbi:hypothetical protein HDU96_008513 [Phlyctochytrium bullatum]|nr:hypothetical protein HDU96_008513 [Phlyctochytrium bullatum]
MSSNPILRNYIFLPGVSGASLDDPSIQDPACYQYRRNVCIVENVTIAASLCTVYPNCAGIIVWDILARPDMANVVYLFAEPFRLSDSAKSGSVFNQNAYLRVGKQYVRDGVTRIAGSETTSRPTATATSTSTTTSSFSTTTFATNAVSTVNSVTAGVTTQSAPPTENGGSSVILIAVGVTVGIVVIASVVLVAFLIGKKRKENDAGYRNGQGPGMQYAQLPYNNARYSTEAAAQNHNNQMPPQGYPQGHPSLPSNSVTNLSPGNPGTYRNSPQAQQPQYPPHPQPQYPKTEKQMMAGNLFTAPLQNPQHPRQAVDAGVSLSPVASPQHQKSPTKGAGASSPYDTLSGNPDLGSSSFALHAPPLTFSATVSGAPSTFSSAATESTYFHLPTGTLRHHLPPPETKDPAGPGAGDNDKAAEAGGGKGGSFEQIMKSVPVFNWTPDTVNAWLSSKGFNADVAYKIQANGIDGTQLLLLTETRLSTMGIASPGVCRAILAHIDVLREESAKKGGNGGAPAGTVEVPPPYMYT